MQEEQRIGLRIAEAASKSETGALLSKCKGSCANCNVASNNRPKCDHCGKLGHSIDKCWKKFPEFNPHKKKQLQEHPAFIVNQGEDDPNVICLIGDDKTTPNETTTDAWYIDSGCSNHMTYNKSLFSSLNYSPISQVELGNGTKADIVGRGTIKLNIISHGKSVPCMLKNVYLVPGLGYQLLSVSSLATSGLSTIFESKKCWIKRNNSVLASGSLDGTLYCLDVPSDECKTPKALLSSSIQVWHERLAHVDPSTIRNMVNKKIVTGVNIKKSSFDNFKRDGCVLGKAHRAGIPRKSHSRSSKVLELIHSDVNGPLETSSLGGSKYFITFIDDYSRWTAVYMMRRKSDSLNMFKKYHKYVQVHTGHSVLKLNFIQRTSEIQGRMKSIRTDNGGEYISNAFKQYLIDHGISHQLTIAYTPQQNGVAERMNRTLIDLVRSMLLTAGIGKEFWAEALETAVYVRNRVTSRSLKEGMTPHHLWYGNPLDLSHLRIFGSDCFYTIPTKNVKKLDARANPAIFVGYFNQSKGYKLWDPAKRKMIVSRDVTFREIVKLEPETADSCSQNHIEPRGDAKVRFDVVTLDDEESTDDSLGFKGHDNNEIEEMQQDDDDTSEDDESHAEESTPKSLRRSFRKFTKTKPFWKQYSSFSAVALAARIVPISYQAAVAEDNIDFWKPGIDREHDCLLRNNTWTIVDYLPGMHVLPSKYVFRIKNGEPKARMVVLGCKQIFGLDYYDTFAPVVKFSTVRSLLAIVAAEDYECEQMDVVTAFLNGDLDEDIYMKIPEGLKDEANEGKVCKLNKALYGLKQAPRQWYAKIHEYLVNDLKFESSMNDPCLYIRKAAEVILIIALYVDDLLIIGNSKVDINRIKEEFKKRFEMKDLGPAEVMLGIEISRDRQNRKLHISQREYIENILHRFRMGESKAVSTPMVRETLQLSGDSQDFLSEDVPYRQAVGCLIYLVSGSRPDISFAVSKLSQFLEKPLQLHWTAVKRVMRYLSGTRTEGIMYDGARGIEIEGFSDSDYAGDILKRKSTSGYVFLIAGGAVSWKSKKQPVTATSTCEAEYIACCAASKEAIWLSRILGDIRMLAIPQQVTIGIDNNGTIHLASNPTINERSKHIDVKFHFVRESVASKKIKIIHCSTENQLADPLTKPLDSVKLERFKSLQSIVGRPSRPSSSRRSVE